jgi:glycosyltransferase involved in cell wall biosynthesis
MTKRTKLTIATGIFPPSIGGPATYSKLMLDELPKKGIDVNIATFDAVRRYPKVLRHLLFFVIVFRKSFMSDVVLAQDTVSVGLPTLLSCKILRKKFIVRVPGDYAWEQSVQRYGVKDGIDDFQVKKYSWRIEFLRYIQKIVVRNADVVITPSEYFKKLVSGWGGAIQPVRIYNGIENFTCSNTKDSKRKEIGLLKDDFVIVSVGRLVPWKGFTELIEMMQSFDHDLNIKLVIIGDGPEAESLKTKVESMDLNEKVFLVGRQKREDVLRYLCSADVFVLNTYFESFSFQTVEAMKAGLPVVITRTGSLPELIDHGKNGYLVKPGDINDIMEKILKIKNNPDLRRSLSEFSQEKSNNFSIERTIKGVEGKIFKLLKK